MKNFLSKTGLSMSQAQSISNICYQRVIEIDAKIASVNNASKVVRIGGEALTETQGIKMPVDIVNLIINKGRLCATQAFLMEAIKAKESLLDTIKYTRFDSEAFSVNNPEPVMDEIIKPMPISEVDEKWGWEQLSTSETAEFLEVEAYAAQIGKFIHKDGKLTRLRTELPLIKTLEWITVEDGKKTPLKVILHHTPEQLMNIHIILAEKHREYEARVNYFKAKVKNLVTLENVDRAKDNAEALANYTTEYKIARKKYTEKYVIWRAELDKAIQNFEEAKAKETKEVASLRISVDPRFQEVIDEILQTIKMVEGE